MKIKERFLELDVLRGWASLAVVLAHFVKEKDASAFGFNIGSMGVDLFFIISGFVVLLTATNSSVGKIFIYKRFSRIYPVYWFAVIFTTCLIFLNTQSSFVYKESYELTNNLFIKSVINLTMFQYYFQAGEIDGQYWTLIIELFFYCLIYLFIVFKRLEKVELYGTILMMFSSLYFFDFINEHFVFHKIKMLLVVLPYTPLFLAGILIYKLKVEDKSNSRLLLLMITYLAQCMLFFNTYRNNSIVTFEVYSLVLALIYVIFVLFIFNKLSYIVNKPFVWLGKISYSLYLIHQYVGVFIIIPFLNEGLKLEFWFSVLVAIGLVIIIAGIIHTYIEVPTIVKLRKYLYNRDKANE